MQGVALLGAGIVLVGTAAFGLVAHEFAHAATLYGFGVPFDVRWFPGREPSTQGAGRLSGTWASVTPSRVPAGVPTWGIQLSALAPLVLTFPLLLFAVGVLPSPSMDNPFVAAITVSWLACSLPSPQDFSVFWYADAAVTELQETPTLDE